MGFSSFVSFLVSAAVGVVSATTDDPKVNPEVNSATKPESSACPLLGPNLPRPKNLYRSEILRQSLAHLTGSLNEALDGKINPGFPTNETSFSIIFTDSRSKSRNLPWIWEYHYTASARNNGTNKVDSNSQYRVASITKVLTDLLLLRLGINIYDPITKFIPELASGKGTIQWANVTLRDLGSHLSGLQSSYGFGEVTGSPMFLTQQGFPQVSQEELPVCGITGTSGACNKDKLISAIANLDPLFPLHSRASYSNIAFTLLGYAVQNFTGKPYIQALKDAVTVPLGMARTGFTPGPLDSAVIPPVKNQVWGVDFDEINPAGGAYSTSSDISRLLNAILDGSILSPQELANWVKPHTFSSRINSAVGFPWEIVRTQKLAPKPHVVDLYSKVGAVPGYYSRMSFIDDYGIGFVVLTAGGSTALPALSEAVLASVFPAVDKAAREEVLNAGYTGNFTAGGNSWINLKLDSGPGLLVTGWWSNGIDFMQTLRSIGAGNYLGDFYDIFRLFPSSGVGGSGDVLVDGEEEWVLLMEPSEQRRRLEGRLPTKGVWDNGCHTWQSVGWLSYGGKLLDKFSFTKSGGKVRGIKNSTLKITLNKN